MKYRLLGRSDLKVSEICLGSMTWGTQNSESEAHAQIDYAHDHGVNIIDTAELYPSTPRDPELQGRTEAHLGTWLAQPGNREKMIVATKVAGSGVKDIRGGMKICRDSILAGVDASLGRLQTDYIDLYQLHWPNRGSYHFRQIWSFDPSGQDRAVALADFEEALDTLGDLIKCGKIRHFGVSNESSWGLMQYLRLAEDKGLPRCVSIQNEYSLMCRYFSPDLAETCQHEEVGLLAYTPVAGGLLTGKYSGGKRPEGSRGTINTELGGRFVPGAIEIADKYVAVAREHGLDPARMAIAFVLGCPQLASAIIGATNLDQLANAIQATEISLDDDVLADIDTIHRAHPIPF